MNTTIKELEAIIEKAYPRPVRLEKTKKKRKEPLTDFLVKFFTEWNDTKSTIYADEDGGEQTDPGRRRSLGDIYMICKYYYPDATLEDVLKELYVTLQDTFASEFRTSFCYTINKRVWYYDEGNDSAIYNKGKYDEWGNPYRFYLAAFLPLEAITPDFDEDEDEGDGECYEDDYYDEDEYYEDDDEGEDNYAGGDPLF